MIANTTTPPAALEAEAAALGSMILEGDAITEVLKILRGPEDFQKPAHVIIAAAIFDVYEAGKPNGLVHLVQHLRDKGQLDDVGGLEYLYMLGETVPNAALAEHYAKIVREKADQRLNGRVVDRLARAINEGATGAEALRIAQENLVQGAGGPTTGPSIVTLSSVPPEAVRWLWKHRIARGKLTLFAGDPGLGKSTATIDIAARVTRGATWPDGSPSCGVGGVVLLNVEDDVADTIRPRFDAAGGDPSRVTIMRGVFRTNHKTGKVETGAFALDENIAALEEAIQQTPDCKLVIIDPVSAYMGSTDSHNNAEVRACLSRASELASRSGVALLAVTHLNKGQGQAIYRATGSLAFVAAARAVFAIGKCPDDPTGKRRLFLPIKNNIGNDRDGLAFEIRQSTPLAASVAWEAGAVAADLDKMLSPPGERPGPERDERDTAVDWLRSMLADGPVLASEVCDQAQNGEGIKDATLRRAKRELKVESYRPENPGPWLWRLPEGAHAHTCSPAPANEHLEHLEHLEHVPIITGFDEGGVGAGAPDAQVIEGQGVRE
ncbi:MAG: AAA family ATPase [Planctomycetes bacterium]|nr:AAA family ATPase [Planctomycetota bacterium]